MDEPRPWRVMLAPGRSSGRTLEAPGERRVPPLDERLVRPETREELTRTSEDSDFAPDISVFPAGEDAETGRRRLEEIAFEIASTQSAAIAAGKAEELVERGVRRVFCIQLKLRRVMEWSHESLSWVTLPADGAIEDPCFAPPLPIPALLGAAAAGMKAPGGAGDAAYAAADEAVVHALDVREPPAMAALKSRVLAQALVESIPVVLGARGLAVPDAVRDRLLATSDPARLNEWLRRAVTAARAEDMLDA